MILINSKLPMSKSHLTRYLSNLLRHTKLHHCSYITCISQLGDSSSAASPIVSTQMTPIFSWFFSFFSFFSFCWLFFLPVHFLAPRILSLSPSIGVLLVLSSVKIAWGHILMSQYVTPWCHVMLRHLTMTWCEMECLTKEHPSVNNLENLVTNTLSKCLNFTSTPTSKCTMLSPMLCFSKKHTFN